MTWVPLLISGLGLIGLLSKRTFLGVLISFYLLILGAISLFVVCGVTSASATKGHVFGFFVLIAGATQLVVGFAMLIRLFYQRRIIEMENLRTLRH